MPQFNDHIKQSCRNLRFLELINKSDSSYFDWQVTVCFYAAVHLVNAHLSLYGMQYRKHVDVKDAINFKNNNAVSKGTAFPEREYLAFTKLQSLSRRSRYLVNEKEMNTDTASLTYPIHLQRAIVQLNLLVTYLARLHKFKIDKIHFNCKDITIKDITFIH